jgi:hypothetical protein
MNFHTDISGSEKNLYNKFELQILLKIQRQNKTLFYFKFSGKKICFVI